MRTGAPVVSATIVVLSRSEPERLGRLIARVAEQDMLPERVLVIWNGAAPYVFAAAAPFAVDVLTIRPEEFGHGRTRNLGLAQTRSDVLVLVSDDAWPADTAWLRHLAGPILDDARVAAAYSRQVAGADAAPAERAFRQARYPADDLELALGPDRVVDLARTPLSNASAAYRVEALRAAGGFDEALGSSEDLAAALALLDAGHRVRYAARSVVEHAHGYPWLEQVRRTYDSASSLRDIEARYRVRPAPGGSGSLRLGLGMLAGALGHGAFGRTFSDVTARALGVALARARGWLPHGVHGRITRQRWALNTTTDTR